MAPDYPTSYPIDFAHTSDEDERLWRAEFSFKFRTLIRGREVEGLPVPNDYLIDTEEESLQVMYHHYNMILIRDIWLNSGLSYLSIA